MEVSGKIGQAQSPSSPADDKIDGSHEIKPSPSESHQNFETLNEPVSETIVRCLSFVPLYCRPFIATFIIIIIFFKI